MVIAIILLANLCLLILGFTVFLAFKLATHHHGGFTAGNKVLYRERMK